jgi:hypothetical protein
MSMSREGQLHVRAVCQHFCCYWGLVITNFAVELLLLPQLQPKLVMPQVNVGEWDRKAISHLQSLLFPQGTKWLGPFHFPATAL